MGSTDVYCLITGASRGIGKAIAEECIKRRMNLFLVALPGSGLEELANHLLKTSGQDVQYLCIDLASADGPQKVYDYVKSHNLVIDILINNAGVGGYGDVITQQSEEIDSMISLNIRATTLLTYYFLSDLKKLPRAYILNFSSFGAFLPLPKKSIYAATKSYILFFSRALSNELKNTNIRVSSVLPSGVNTNTRIKNSINNSRKIIKITSLNPEEVAKYSIKSMLKGKKLILPGTATKIFYVLGSILPYGIVFKIVEKVFSKTS